MALQAREQLVDQPLAQAERQPRGAYAERPELLERREQEVDEVLEVAVAPLDGFGRRCL